MSQASRSARSKVRANEHPQYNPDTLLDNVKQHLGLRSDAALSRTLDVLPSVISKIRHRVCAVSSQLLIAMHEETDMSIRDLRYLGGDFRIHTGPSSPVVPPQNSGRGVAL